VAPTVDIVSDIVCPWCYIGKRRLEAALAQRAKEEPGAEAPVVTWRPFQLNPDLPAAGVERQEYMRRKFGPRLEQAHARLAEMGRTVGIEFAFEAINRQPNTIAGHSLVHLAGMRGVQDAVVEALFRAFFVDAADLTREETLLDVVAAAGLDRNEAAAWLANPEARRTIALEDERARQIGVEGVPFFIFNGRLAVSGAHEPDVLLRAMRESETAAA